MAQGVQRCYLRKGDNARHRRPVVGSFYKEKWRYLSSVAPENTNRGLLLRLYFDILCGFKRFLDVEDKNEAKK
jgi:hypothetical protein